MPSKNHPQVTGKLLTCLGLDSNPGTGERQQEVNDILWTTQSIGTLSCTTVQYWYDKVEYGTVRYDIIWNRLLIAATIPINPLPHESFHKQHFLLKYDKLLEAPTKGC